MSDAPKAFESFGRDVLDWLRNEMFLSEAGEELMEMALNAGLVQRVKYEPADHGIIDDAEPGDEVWWFGKRGQP